MTTEQMDRVTSSRVHVSHTASLTTGETLTMADIRNLADTEGVPASARVTFQHYAGDFRESGSTTITLSW